MTTTITIKTHDKGAVAIQSVVAHFDGETKREAIPGLPIATPPHSEMTFYATFGQSLTVAEDVSAIQGIQE